MARLERELGLAKKLALEASRGILEIYATDFKVDLKGKDDPVTLADRQANELIVRELSEVFPGDAVVGEESDLSQAFWVGKERIWYIDPVDGTKEFVEKNGQFAIHIGLATEGEATLGVVYQPTTGTMYSGVVGEGAWVERNGIMTTLQPSDQSSLKDATVVHTRSHKSEALQALIDALGVTHGLPRGSVGLKVGTILEKEADFYLETTSYSKAWDSCGPEAIMRAAGGSFTNLRGDQIRYGVAELRNMRGLLASNGPLHTSVLAKIQPLLSRFNL